MKQKPKGKCKAKPAQTAQQKKNIKDATMNKNMRPVFEVTPKKKK